ncbi:MAG: c-type cytochrome [Chloroflexi bacterium]|nr:c-type cytochrome [Chloroflexota bacterium]
MNFDFSNIPALILAGALVLLLVGLLVYAARASRPGADLPSGPPTGVVAMERKVAATTFLIAAMALLFLGYGLREPTRQVEAQDSLLDISIGRGITQYATLCYSCHGQSGQGAQVPDAQPVRVAPALNRPDMRPTDADERKKRFDFIFKTIQRGRPGTPMPAWGQSDGGALFDEQMNELTLMILNGDREITFGDQPRATVWKQVETLVTQEIEAGTAKMPLQPQVENQPFYADLTDPQKQGVRVILQKSCGGCHAIPNIPGAAGNVGPSLAGVGSRDRIAGGAIPNTSVDDLAKWIQNPQALKPGTAMPNLGLTAEEARNAAEYLSTLK